MTDLHTTVRISGIVLGSLMFQHFNSDSDVEGFILGESKAEERSNITDSQMNQVQYEHTVHIQKHISCQKLSSFYNGVGEVKWAEIKHILAGDKKENVLGWYRQRRNTEQRMTFREQVVHRNLQRALSNHELVFLLLTPAKASSIGSTHRLEYSVFRSHGSQYHNIPMVVSNLGMLEQQDYRRSSTSCSSSSYNRAIKKHRSKFFTSDGSLKEVGEVSAMNDTLQAELKMACANVEKSERTLELLSADVAALRKDIAVKRSNQTKTDLHSVSEMPQENMLLCAALRALFPESPLLRTQTLTQQGTPLPEYSCNVDHNIDVPTALPLVLAHQHAREQRWGLGEKGRNWGKRRCTEASHTTQRKRRDILETDSEEAITVSGSETDEELLDSQNINLKQSNSPVF
ncbi:BRCA1-A complex subunit Abraxas [Arapaima gigas]